MLFEVAAAPPGSVDQSRTSFSWPAKSPKARSVAVVEVPYTNSSVRQPLVDGVAVQVAADAADVGAMIRLGRAICLLSTVTVSETTVVLVLVSPSSSEEDTCQVVAAVSGLVNSVTVPSGPAG